MEVRRLTNTDLPALLALLEPTEAQSLFLVGNAQERGLDDQGGGLQGTWMGAFEGGSLRGVIAHFRGPNSVVPACHGHASRLVPALAEALAATPGVLVGTSERVDEALRAAPSGWRVQQRKREVLLVLPWERYRPAADAVALALPVERAAEAAELITLLHREGSMPTDQARNLASAQRYASEGRLRVREHQGRAVAMSCEATSTGRFLHIGATVCRAEHRRRGHAAACVSAVIDEARRAGRASRGAALFTGDDNRGALALYERLGFEPRAPWELCFLG